MKPAIALFVMIAAFFVPVAHADDSFHPYWYVTANAGTTKTGWENGGQEFSYRSIGGSLGYQFNETFGVEIFTSSTRNSEPEDILSSLIDADVKTSFDAQGAFLTAKTHGKAYLEGRVGLAESNFTYSATGYQSEKSSDVALAFGLAGGVQFENVRLEFGYLLLPDVEDPLPFFGGQVYESSSLDLSISYDFR